MRGEKAKAVVDAEQNHIFLDPIVHGRYPALAREQMLPPSSLIHEGDMELISAPLDFIGINYYSPYYIKRAAPAEAQLREERVAGFDDVVIFLPPELPTTNMGWLVEPDGLYDLLMTVTPELHPGCKLYITENGCAAQDYVESQRRRQRHRADRVPQRPPGRGLACDPGRSSGGRLLPVVTTRQFRVGLGLPEAFRAWSSSTTATAPDPKQSAHFYKQVAATNALPAVWKSVGSELAASAS